MSEWDFYDAREGARSIYVTPIMPCGRAVLPLAARGVGAEPWVDGRARIGREILVLSDTTSAGKGLKKASCQVETMYCKYCNRRAA